MRAKVVTRMFLFVTPRRVSRLDTIKNFLFALIVFALAGTLGLLSVSYDGKQKSLPFNSGSFIHRSHLDGLIQEKNLLLNDDSAVKEAQKSLRQFPIGDFELLSNLHLNLHREVFLDRVKSSSYILIFASPPLRSPPFIS